MKLAMAALCLSIAACGSGGERLPPVHDLHDGPDRSPVPLAAEISDGYRRHPLSLFGDYPADVRPLIRQFEVEHEICTGIRDSRYMRVCNLRYRTHVELERRGLVLEWRAVQDRDALAALRG